MSNPRINSPIYSEIDLSRDGKQLGFLRLPHSVNRSAYGWIPIPIASIKRGAGPRVLVMAGNHGDEYEGQIIVSRLIRELDARQVHGQLILLPMANYPAAAAGSRVSPIGGGNLNRIFPGDPAGSVTRVIAHYIEHVLMPGCQYLIPVLAKPGMGFDEGYSIVANKMQRALRLDAMLPGRSDTQA